MSDFSLSKLLAQSSRLSKARPLARRTTDNDVVQTVQYYAQPTTFLLIRCATRTCCTLTTRGLATGKLLDYVDTSRHRRLNLLWVNLKTDFNRNRNVEWLHKYSMSFATATSLDYENMDIMEDCEVAKLFNRPTSWTTVKSLHYSLDQCHGPPWSH